jgi:hypothetical protein
MTFPRKCLIAALLTTLAPVPRARACATVFEEGGPRPHIKQEEALIVWDAERKVEHFIRSARFGGAKRSFGFLVPTPARPQLAGADDAVFRRLADIYQRPPAPIPILDDDSAPAPVTVVERKRVAGMDAAVLLASDPAALARWLREQGFTGRADLDAWLAPYVARGFHITAFRYLVGTQPTITSHAVRLSFAAERPFYPYAEPRDAAVDSARRLRVSVVAPWRAAGTVGDKPWEARTGFADRPRGVARILAGAVPAGTRSGPWLTTFEELPSRRGSSDLFFAAAPTQQPVPPSLDP